jgi:hypothetical protein
LGIDCKLWGEHTKSNEEDKNVQANQVKIIRQMVRCICNARYKIFKGRREPSRLHAGETPANAALRKNPKKFNSTGINQQIWTRMR